MKRPLQLSLAIALALGATNAFALGLGAIQVQSGLNQPLLAEIPIIQSSPGEAEGLIVQLASTEDFERVGMNRATIGVPVDFSLGKNARGEPVIKVTSKEIVREPFIGMLLEANWPKGRLLREYTILLDPPVMAPAIKGSSAVAVAAKEPERSSTEALPPSKPATPRPAPAASAPAKPAVAAGKPSSPPPPAPSRAATGSEYGPVAAGETLGQIARATRPDDAVSINQMMVALLKNNPQAFFKDNVNALKRGAVLRIPSAEEIAASGSAREAAAAVRSQIDEWRGSVSSAPTLVADTTASTPRASTSASTSTSSGERLALVPPREGKADEGSADRPTGGRAGGTGDAASKAELARVKEALTSKEQESGELKSRVKDLEEIKGKNEKLINLQSTELAELRDKLKKLQDEKDGLAATVTTPAAAPTLSTAVAPPTPAAGKADTGKPEVTVSKDDIWGDASATGEKPKVADAAAPPSSATAAEATPTPPALDSSTTQIKPEPAAVEPVKPAPTKPVEAKKPTPKPAPAIATPPAPVDTTPWYLQPWALAVAGIGGLLLVVLGMLGLRKRKPVAKPARQSIAASFGDSPLAGAAAVAGHDDAEEQELIAQVKADPGNANAHLELLSLYYAQGAAAKFEAGAEEMYAYVADPNQASWREVRKMGEELAPHNPLFSDQDSIVDDFSQRTETEPYHFDDAEPGAPAEFPDYPDFADESESELLSPKAPESFETASMPTFDALDFGSSDSQPPAPASAPSADVDFLIDLPPLEEQSPAASISKPEASFVPAPLPDFRARDTTTVEVPVAEVSDDEFFAGEDAIGTKLDLAKAYLDMGDPDGARSMLEEVIAEGAPAQQDEARKLIAEIS